MDIKKELNHEEQVLKANNKLYLKDSKKDLEDKLNKL